MICGATTRGGTRPRVLSPASAASAPSHRPTIHRLLRPVPTPLRPAPFRAPLRPVSAQADPDVDTKPTTPDTPPASTPARSAAAAPRATAPSPTTTSTEFSWDEFLQSDLPKKIGVLLALIFFSRVGVYLRVPGVDVDAFASSLSQNGIFGYVDALSGGSISRVGLFSLGIIPYINASIVMQLFAAAFPSLKKMQREDGAQGRSTYTYYTKLASFLFAIVQAAGQLTYIRPYVEDFTPLWLASNTLALTAGAMALVYVADTINELKLGNGTSVLIFASIASSLPSSVSAVLTSSSPSTTATYFAVFLLTTLGIIYVQEAERRIPVNYSSSYTRGNLARQSYLPFKVNATGVMPLIFASSLLTAPSVLARYSDNAVLEDIARSVAPGGFLYLPFNIALIVFFNYYYTFLQLEPKELSEQLKKSGAAIPSLRPGRQTAEFVTKVLNRLSVLGSVFLGVLASAPAAVESLTGMTALRGFAGTSVLIMVGVATDTARRIRAEQAMAKYQDVDKLYDNMKL